MSAAISNDEFDSALARIIVRDASIILYIPGVYEVLAEHYNNEILETFELKQEEDGAA